MCKFKSCGGRHDCLLSKSSPCEGTCPGLADGPSRRVTSRNGGVSYKGFLEWDFVIDALGLDDDTPLRDRAGDTANVA